MAEQESPRSALFLCGRCVLFRLQTIEKIKERTSPTTKTTQKKMT